MNFENKTAIITGSSGIALATAIALAKEGAQVHIAGIDEGHNAEAKNSAVNFQSLSTRLIFHMKLK
jgi:meso-butanediol dehydrogenase/(S,S)-butanediol dehydrogenase/diacetyl reductase